MRAGQNPAHLPDYSIREATVIVEAAMERDQRLAHLHGGYTAFAFHQPDKMPDPDERQRARPAEPRTTEADLVQVKAWMKAMAGTSDGD